MDKARNRNFPIESMTIASRRPVGYIVCRIILKFLALPYVLFGSYMECKFILRSVCYAFKYIPNLNLPHFYPIGY